MRARPITPLALVDLLVELIVARSSDDGSGWRSVRVAVDGAPAAAPGSLADDLVDPLRARGRPVVRVPAAGFPRPASVRWELGREDPDSFYERWLDDGALAREVIDPLGPSGSGRFLPSLWDVSRDRATREPYGFAAQGTVLLVDGTFLLGRWLDFDLSIHLTLSHGALLRRTVPADAWTLPAYMRYDVEIDPVSSADVVVRCDDPRRPALVEQS